MPPRPVLQRPPKAPDTALPRSKAPSWFELATQTLGGALGLTPLTAEDYDTPEGGQSIDRAGALGELLSMGLGVGTLGAAMRGPKAAKGTLGQATRIPNPIKAYHGSPHDFDQFSLSKIGTGEGAQAYGHGLYFAENQGVAKQYRDDLSTPTLKYKGHDLPEPVKGRDFLKLTDDQIVDEAARDFIRDARKGVRHNATLEDLIERAAGEARVFAVRNPEQKAHWLAAEQRIKDMAKDLKVQDGKMYEVNLHASPDELLDWDKPLSEQPQKVREALESLHYPEGPISTPMKVDKASRSGGELYGAMHENYTGTATKAAEALKAKGIKGIQYLDQGSRGGNVDRWLVTGPTGIVRDFGSEAEAMKAMGKIEGAKLTKPNVTRNFVIFDDQLIEIAKKYGIPLATAASLVEQQGGTVEKRQ